MRLQLDYEVDSPWHPVGRIVMQLQTGVVLMHATSPVADSPLTDFVEVSPGQLIAFMHLCGRFLEHIVRPASLMIFPRRRQTLVEVD